MEFAAGSSAKARNSEPSSSTIRLRSRATSQKSTQNPAGPSRRSTIPGRPEVGGLQNNATNLGAAIGTALAGSILIVALTAAFLQGVQQNPAIPEQVKSQASVQLAGGVPFLSDGDLQAALNDAGASAEVTQAALEVNKQARVAGLRSALAVLALIALLGLFSARRIPSRPPQASPG